MVSCRNVAEGYSVEDILACTEADVIVPDEIGVMRLIIDAGKHIGKTALYRNKIPNAVAVFISLFNLLLAMQYLK